MLYEIAKKCPLLKGHFCQRSKICEKDDKRKMEKSDSSDKSTRSIYKDGESLTTSIVTHGPCYLFYPVALEKESKERRLFIPTELSTTFFLEVPITDFLDREQNDGIHKRNERKQHKRISDIQIIKFINHLVKAVSWLHDKAIVHKDIRGRNVFVTRNSSHNFIAKLALCGVGGVNQYVRDGKGYYNDLDFKSIFKDQMHEEDLEKDFLNMKKKEMSIFHQPPEIHKRIKQNKLNVADDFNKETDIYQLGCTMFQMITYNVLPFTNHVDKLDKKLREMDYNSKNIIESDIFKNFNSKLGIATYHQPGLQRLMEACTKSLPELRPGIKLIDRYHMVNILGQNGLSEDMAMCQCGASDSISDTDSDKNFFYF